MEKKSEKKSEKNGVDLYGICSEKTGELFSLCPYLMAEYLE